MVPKKHSEPLPALDLLGNGVGAASDSIPSKAQILEDIRQGYHFAKAGGEGQPIDEMHREIAQELAREELEDNADTRHYSAAIQATVKSLNCSRM